MQPNYDALDKKNYLNLPAHLLRRPRDHIKHHISTQTQTATRMAFVPLNFRIHSKNCIPRYELRSAPTSDKGNNLNSRLCGWSKKGAQVTP